MHKSIYLSPCALEEHCILLIFDAVDDFSCGFFLNKICAWVQEGDQLVSNFNRFVSIFVNIEGCTRCQRHLRSSARHVHSSELGSIAMTSSAPARRKSIASSEIESLGVLKSILKRWNSISGQLLNVSDTNVNVKMVSFNKFDEVKIVSRINYDEISPESTGISQNQEPIDAHPLYPIVIQLTKPQVRLPFPTFPT